MIKEIHIPVGQDQEITLAPFSKGNRHFSIWLCQGSYNKITKEWGTQFHISDFELDMWLEHLQDIKNRREFFLKDLQEKRDVFAEIASATDNFYALYNRKAQKLCVNTEFLELLIEICLDSPGISSEDKIRLAQKNIKVVEKLNLQCFGLQVVRRFDEIKEECGFILE